jgi:rhamnose transport system substrate-binding protein
MWLCKYPQLKEKKMSSFKSKRIRVISAIVASLALTLTGTAFASAAGKTMANCPVTLIPKTTDNPFFAAIHYGADQAATELSGKKVNFTGTAQTDAQGQIQRVQAATTNKACVINIASVDSTALVPALTAAKKAGVKVVTYDADVLPKARTLFISQDSEKALGVGMFKALAAQMNYKGDYAILSAQSTAQNQNAWLREAANEAKKPQYKNMHLVKTVYGDDDDKKSYDQAVALMNAYPKLSGIFTPEPAGLGGAVKAKDDLKYDPNLVITGLGWPPGQGDLLKSGKVKSFILWSPVDLGYLTYYANNALVTGKITGRTGDTFMAGRLGKMTVGANGVVIMNGMVTYTAGNVDSLLDGYKISD